MNAVMSDKPKPTRLELPITRQMPRKLIIEFERYGGGCFHAHAHAFVRAGDRMVSVAFGGAHKLEDVSLRYATDAPVLWLGHAQFELTDKEAAEVERVFVPVGLRIEHGPVLP